MDESNKGKTSGTERRDLSGTDEGRRRENSFVLPDGREIWNYKNPATIVTVGLVSFVLLIGSTTLIGYRAGRSEVEQICWDTVPKVKYDDDSPTVRGKFRQLDETNRDWKYKYESLEQKITTVKETADFCANWINDPGKKKGKQK